MLSQINESHASSTEEFAPSSNYVSLTWNLRQTDSILKVTSRSNQKLRCHQCVFFSSLIFFSTAKWVFSILGKGDLLIALWCHSAVKLYDKVSVPSVAAANCRRMPWETACFTDKPYELWNVWGAVGPAVPQVKLFSPLNLEQSAQATLRQKGSQSLSRNIWKIHVFQLDVCQPTKQMTPFICCSDLSIWIDVYDLIYWFTWNTVVKVKVTSRRTAK